MPDLIAQGREPKQRWRRTITEGVSQTIGREANNLSVTWDDLISRHHIEVEVSGKTLHVTQLDDAVNPVFFHGKPKRQFSVETGDHFVVGNTTFTWLETGGDLSVRTTPAVSSIIREGATQTLYDVITGGKQYGMQFMDDAIMAELMASKVAGPLCNGITALPCVGTNVEPLVINLARSTVSSS